jgi:hypothetical protein
VRVNLSDRAAMQARGFGMGNLVLLAMDYLGNFYDCEKTTGPGVLMVNHRKDRSIPTRLISEELGEVWFWWDRKGIPPLRHIEISRFEFKEQKEQD